MNMLRVIQFNVNTTLRQNLYKNTLLVLTVLLLATCGLDELINIPLCRQSRQLQIIDSRLARLEHNKLLLLFGRTLTNRRIRTELSWLYFNWQ